MPIVAYAAAPGPVQDLDCTSGHNSIAIQDKKIIMSWDYPSGHSGATIPNFFYEFNTESNYNITTGNSQTPDLSTFETVPDSDNVAYYFHIAPIDNDFIFGPNLGPTSTYGPMRVDNVGPTGATVSGPEETNTNLKVPLALGANSATQMCISNTGSGIDCNWEPVAAQKEWDLTEGFGSKTVYALFKDNAGNLSGAITTINYVGQTLTRARYVSVPSLNEYGMMILFIVLAGCSVKHLRKRY